MEIVASFIAGLAVGLTLLVYNGNTFKLEVLSSQKELENCQQQLIITESKLSGMLMNK